MAFCTGIHGKIIGGLVNYCTWRNLQGLVQKWNMEVFGHIQKRTRMNRWKTVKVGLKKAYNRLDWEFIDEMLQEIGLLNSLRRVLMYHVCLVSMQLFIECESFKRSNKSNK
ncbi:uncharacterized protein LOC120140567 [Hibiscus syriacus]|uniref:uncharacterized protein LOC120140567 n=1 Tax=Hibiscus syriacus TaxID=106335 RepID=UPI0019250E49|nr:uncharacterized protein LOC120140567 [Hibiscus syriacus]